MQTKYSTDKLQVVLLSTDHSREFYDSRADALFKKYGGAEWPSVLFDGGWEGSLHFGDFGYGKIILDEKGIVRAIQPRDLEAALAQVFRNSSGK